MSDFVAQAGPLRELVERELARLFTPEGFITAGKVPPGLAEAMRHALSGDGKRLRAVLCLAACQAVCGDPAPALPAALAVEVLYAGTLVHGDLACMDEDAVPVGDALQAAAFELALTPPRSGRNGVASRSGWGTALQLRLARTFAAAAGAGVACVHGHKPGGLIECAVNLGAIAAGAPTRVLLATAEYGRSLGIALQIVDDLPAAGDPAKTEEARGRVRAATERALRAVPAIGDEPGAVAPWVPEEVAKAWAASQVSLAALGVAGAADPDAPAKAEALALLRALAEEPLSRLG